VPCKACNPPFWAEQPAHTDTPSVLHPSIPNTPPLLHKTCMGIYVQLAAWVTIITMRWANLYTDILIPKSEQFKAATNKNARASVLATVIREIKDAAAASGKHPPDNLEKARVPSSVLHEADELIIFNRKYLTGSITSRGPLLGNPAHQSPPSPQVPTSTSKHTASGMLSSSNMHKRLPTWLQKSPKPSQGALHTSLVLPTCLDRGAPVSN
jgi:hypothetical protein